MFTRQLCHEFYSTYEFDEVCTDDEFQTKKIIKFRLGGRAHSLTLLEFDHRLGLYHVGELDEEGFNEHFNAQEYWLSINQEENLSLSRSQPSTIRSLVCECGLVDYEVDEEKRSWNLDTITLSELIDFEGRLILEDPQSGIPRVSIPRPLRASM
ncbi:hypothetical protein Tco_1305907 [Tanacetum coccineum]